MGGKYYWDEVIVYQLYLTSPARLTQYIVILIDLKVVLANTSSLNVKVMQYVLSNDSTAAMRWSVCRECRRSQDSREPGTLPIKVLLDQSWRKKGNNL